MPPSIPSHVKPYHRIPPSCPPDLPGTYHPPTSLSYLISHLLTPTTTSYTITLTFMLASSHSYLLSFQERPRNRRIFTFRLQEANAAKFVVFQWGFEIPGRYRRGFEEVEETGVVRKGVQVSVKNLGRSLGYGHGGEGRVVDVKRLNHVSGGDGVRRNVPTEVDPAEKLVRFVWKATFPVKEKWEKVKLEDSGNEKAEEERKDISRSTSGTSKASKSSKSTVDSAIVVDLDVNEGILGHSGGVNGPFSARPAGVGVEVHGEGGGSDDSGLEDSGVETDMDSSWEDL